MGRFLALGAVVLAVAVAVSAANSASSADRSATALRLVKVASGLRSPVLVTAPRSEPGRLYVVEQGGTIRVLENGRVRATPFLDIRGKVVSGGEQGLLGLAFAPDYATSRIFVVYYTDRRGSTAVVRYRSNGVKAIPSSARSLLTVAQPYGNHNGGMVAYGPDKRLYVGTGDGGSAGDPDDRAQDRSSLLGKLLRLDPRKPAGKPVLVALGLRNPWRFSFDRERGDLWIGDVGQNAIEEIDRVRWPLGGLLNFGWDVFEGSSSFESKSLGPGRLVRPIAQYSHDSGCSVTGGHVYRGKALPSVRGRYFYGDFCSGTVWSLRVAGGKAQVRQEPFRVDSLSAFGEDAAGELYLVSLAGSVYRLAG